MFLTPVTIEEVSRVIGNLKNSASGLNKISTHLLKLTKDIISPPLAELINYSFFSGQFPDTLKIACVTPIFKAGDKEEINNYRPISVLPIFAKVMEKCMYQKVINFLSKYKILSQHQFGFIRGKSCVDAVSSFTEYIYKGLET